MVLEWGVSITLYPLHITIKNRESWKCCASYRGETILTRCLLVSAAHQDPQPAAQQELHLRLPPSWHLLLRRLLQLRHRGHRLLQEVPGHQAVPRHARRQLPVPGAPRLPHVRRYGGSFNTFFKRLITAASSTTASAWGEPLNFGLLAVWPNGFCLSKFLAEMFFLIFYCIINWGDVEAPHCRGCRIQKSS